MPGLVEVVRGEGIEGVRYALWDMTGWRRDYDPYVRRSRVDEEKRRVGWDMRVRMKKTVASVLHEANKRQVGEATDAIEERPKGFYRRSF